VERAAAARVAAAREVVMGVAEAKVAAARVRAGGATEAAVRVRAVVATEAAARVRAVVEKVVVVVKATPEAMGRLLP
jgi:hypothetical protein